MSDERPNKRWKPLPEPPFKPPPQRRERQGTCLLQRLAGLWRICLDLGKSWQGPRSPGTYIIGSWVMDSIGLYREPRTGPQDIGNWASRERWVGSRDGQVRSSCVQLRLENAAILALETLRPFFNMEGTRTTGIIGEYGESQRSRILPSMFQGFLRLPQTYPLEDFPGRSPKALANFDSPIGALLGIWKLAVLPSPQFPKGPKYMYGLK